MNGFSADNAENAEPGLRPAAVSSSSRQGSATTHPSALSARSAVNSLVEPRSRSGRLAHVVAREAALAAGDIIRQGRRTGFSTTLKGPRNPVTEVDLAAERLLVDRLLAEFPDHGVLAEEQVSDDRPGLYRWLIDPLDGTRNYVRGIPHCCVSLALEREGQILLGIVYDPLRHELFSARYRKGAWLGKRRLALDPAITLNAALIGFDIGYDDAVAGEALGWASRLWPGPQSFRIMGSAALGLAYVAAGRLDLYFHLRLYPWDTAAGMLLVREAGGLVTDRHGGPADLSSRSCVAAAAPLLKSFCSRLEQPGTLARASPAPEPLDPRSRVPNRPKE